MIEEATVDAYGESEQVVGFLTMLEEHLRLPFKTEMPGMEVTVERLTLTDDEQIIAVCSRGKSRQSVPILSLTLPAPPPEGAEWIEGFRHWARGLSRWHGNLPGKRLGCPMSQVTALAAG